MADYKELLRRAVEALPENNGAARRAVYEKARAALVGQLRAINPPLPARDITTHRLQLEDCIRQVEQEASEAVIAGMNSGHESSAPPAPVYFEAPPGQKALVSPNRAAAKPVLIKETPKPLPAGGTIEDIIIAANKDTAGPKALETSSKPEPRPETHAVSKPMPMRLAAPEPEPEEIEAAGDTADEPPAKPAITPGGRALPSIVARAEAAKGRSNSTVFGVPQEKPYDSQQRRGPTLEPRRDGLRLEPAARGGAAIARQPVTTPVGFVEQHPVAAAMSAVREVEVEPQPADPQGTIDRAIATLDREARGETAPANDFDVEMDEDEGPAASQDRKKGLADMFASRDRAESAAKPERQAKLGTRALREDRPAKGRGNREATFAETGFPRARPEVERGGIGAVTIFLIVFAVLLAGAGGAGFWAVNQGYIDLETMFGSRPATTETAAAVVTQPPAAEPAEPATGPGNTATPAEAPTPATELKAEERLTPEPALSGSEPLALAATPEEGKSEERLGVAANGEPDNAEAAVAAIDPANMAGSQSLLLEASDDGTTGAVPFSGTVDWSKGKDETGLPTLIGKASIPARNLGVDVLIRKNSDPSLPASHLMEINFRVSDSFIGGSVAGLPGVLLKNEELVQGAPLVGASARVVGNSFLFALSASPEDTTANNNLLTSRKWMDLAVIYATGKRAIITLEKDAAAETMFKEVFDAWGQTAAASGG
jgi:hypothetical protein